MGIKSFRDNKSNGNLSLKQGIMIGGLISLIMSFFTTGFFLIYFNYINPDFVVIMIVEQVENVIAEGVSLHDIKFFMSLIDWVSSNWGLAVICFVPPLLGGIFLSTVYSFLLKRQFSPLGSNGSGKAN